MKLYIKNNITIGESKYIPNAFFFNKNWLNLVTSTFHYKIKYIFFEDVNIKFIIPFCETRFFFKKYLISLPFSFNNNLDYKIESLIISNIAKLKLIVKKNVDLIIKSKFLNYDKNCHLKTKYNFYTCELINNFEKKFSKNIYRSLNNKKISFEIVKKIENPGFNQFFNNYVLNAKKMGTFFYTKKFIKNIYNQIDGKFFMINSYLENNYLGGQIILLDEKNSEAIYFISSKSELGKKLSIDKILLYKSMTICFKKKIKFFNLGKVNLFNQGLNNFKSQFGAKKIKLNYFSLNKKNYSILDQRSLVKNIVHFSIKYLPLKLYIFINNRIFRFFGMY